MRLVQKIMIFNQRAFSPEENSSESKRLLSNPLIPIRDLNTNLLSKKQTAAEINFPAKAASVSPQIII